MAGTATTAVVAAGVPFAVVMVSAEESFTGDKVPVQIRTDGIFDRALGSADDLDAVLRQSVDRAAADASADQHIDLFAGKQSGKSTMPGIPARKETGRNNLPALAIVDGELRRMSEMLKDKSIFTGNGDFHVGSFLFVDSVWS